ncbi:MAG: lysophospholipid acyltransferase family protein [Myxococcota bacterium]
MSIAARILASILSWFWWWVIPIRKNTAITAFQSHFPNEPAEKMREMMALIILQYLFIVIGKKAEIELEDPPAGGICICAHGMGWDISMLTFGPIFPLTVFFKRPSNPLAARLIEHLRQRSTIQGIYHGQSMAMADAAIESGRLVCFVVDQRYNRGIQTQFFEQPCLSSPAFAALYWRHKPPLFTAWPSHRNGTFVLRFKRLEVPPYHNREECLQQLTQVGQNWVETCIRQDPFQWLWLHLRWKAPSEKA